MGLGFGLKHKNSKNVNKKSEYENFDDTMRKLLKVPYSEIKAKLEAEKRAKQKKRKRREKK